MHNVHVHRQVKERQITALCLYPYQKSQYRLLILVQHNLIVHTSVLIHMHAHAVITWLDFHCHPESH